jgi:hypothetical protein
MAIGTDILVASAGWDVTAVKRALAATGNLVLPSAARSKTGLNWPLRATAKARQDAGRTQVYCWNERQILKQCPAAVYPGQYRQPI